MDLKTKTVSMTSDIGAFEGTIFDMVLYFRSRAIGDLSSFCDAQLNVDAKDFADSGNTYVEDPFILGKDENYEVDPEEQIIDPAEEAVQPPQLTKDILDVNFGTKIGKFQSVISYFDNIISLDGIVADSSTIAQDIVNKFKELDGVYMFYGTFNVTTVQSI